MAKSETTKKAKTAYLIFGILHLLCLLGPFFYFVPYAFITGAVVSKIVLGFTITISLILGLISLMIDVVHRASVHRSITWVMIAGLLFCLTAIKPFIWIMTITSILDELVFTKLRDAYRTKFKTNNEIDKRLSA